jgi:myo-inositol 2-dehydrogenase / D-chiro-inositol 1-dehydrogenase
MSTNNGTKRDGATRRDFLKTTTVAAGAALAGQLSLAPSVHAAGSDAIKVGLIGCGGRGTGAAHNVLVSAKGVTLVGLADAFEDRLTSCRRIIENLAKKERKIKELQNAVDVEGRCYVGLEAYDQLINKSGANYIMLATPPGFRPLHLQAAVAAGKNIFTEKPVAVDAAGIRKVLAAYEDAKKKGLAIAAGTQRRHQLGYIETLKRVHEGAIGKIVAARCYWNQGILWFKKRTDDMTDLQWQMRNWYNFTWLCGDHIVEQHVHNIDVINWATGQHPVRAVGMGGRQRSVRNPEDYGHIFDHFAVDFEYPDGVHVLSECRQINGCENNISEALVGTEGTCAPNAYTINGKRILSRQQDRLSTDPYVQEHSDLIDSIRAGKPINELKNVAESTLSAILGRMSTYTGKAVTWDFVLNQSKEDLMPEKLDWNMSLPVPPVAVPGRTPLV